MPKQTKKIESEIIELEESYNKFKRQLDQTISQGHALLKQMHEKLDQAKTDQILSKVKNKYNN